MTPIKLSLSILIATSSFAGVPGITVNDKRYVVVEKHEVLSNGNQLYAQTLDAGKPDQVLKWNEDKQTYEWVTCKCGK